MIYEKPCQDRGLYGFSQLRHSENCFIQTERPFQEDAMLMSLELAPTSAEVVVAETFGFASLFL